MSDDCLLYVFRFSDFWYVSGNGPGVVLLFVFVSSSLFFPGALSLGASLVLGCYLCPRVLPSSLGATFFLGCFFAFGCYLSVPHSCPLPSVPWVIPLWFRFSLDCIPISLHIYGTFSNSSVDWSAVKHMLSETNRLGNRRGQIQYHIHYTKSYILKSALKHVPHT